MLEIPQALFEKLKEHAESSYPEECCGLLLGHRSGELKRVSELQRAKNLNRERARDRYLMDPKDQIAAERRAREASLEILAYYHSHPDHPAKPSSTDEELSWEQVSYLIVSVRHGKLEESAAFFKNSVQAPLGAEPFQVLA